MLDFGWAELLIIVAVAVFVIGPKDIPNIMYGLGRIMRRIQYVRFAVSQQFEEIMNTGDIEELRKNINFEEKRNEQSIADEQELDEDITETFIKTRASEEEDKDEHDKSSS